MRTESEIDAILTTGIENLKNAQLTTPGRPSVYSRTKWVWAAAASICLIAVFALKPSPVYGFKDYVANQDQIHHYRLEYTNKLQHETDFKYMEYVKSGDQHVTCYYTKMQRLTMEEISDFEQILGTEQLNANVKCMISHDEFFYMRVPFLDPEWKVGEWRTVRRRDVKKNGKSYFVRDYSRIYGEVSPKDYGNTDFDPRPHVGNWFTTVDYANEAQKIKSDIEYRGTKADVYQFISRVSLYTIWVDKQHNRLLEIENDFHPESASIREKIAEVTKTVENERMIFHYDKKGTSEFFEIPSDYKKVTYNK